MLTYLILPSITIKNNKCTSFPMAYIYSMDLSMDDSLFQPTTLTQKIYFCLPNWL